MNAKQELISKIGTNKVLCATIQTDSYVDWLNENNAEMYERTFNLPCDYTEEQYNRFLNSLNFKYDNGYGGQILFGNVWFTDGTWLERGEYDGSEWWEHKYCPEIPKHLKNY